MKRAVFWGIILTAFLSASVQAADIDLKRIVVTPYRYNEEVTKTAASISLITVDEIRQSNAQTILDVLRPVPGLVVRDWFGNTTKASVDIRGFGEQGGMNVVILVDGRRINEVDISAADWTQIPLNQVERIEIIRGGNSVLYGDNATSGVINIITKTPKAGRHFEFGAETGSYDMQAQKFSLSSAKNNLSYWFNSSRTATHGYRDNSFYKARDFSGKLRYDIKDEFLSHVSFGYHRADYGMPGALSSSDLINYGRRFSKYADDEVNEQDYYFLLGTKKALSDWGEFSWDTSYRRRKVFTNFTGANAGWNPLLKSRIDTYGITPKYQLDKPVFDKDNKFISGLDFYRYDYSADTYNNSGVLQDFNDINKISLGGYLQDEFSIFKDLVSVGGFRYEWAEYEFDYHDNSGVSLDVDRRLETNQKAYNCGLVYNYREDSSLFLNINRSFRFPAIDEYFTWGSLNTDLKPQESRNYELYYNPIGGPFGFGSNENYEKTRHQGYEAGLKAKINPKTTLAVNYTYTESTFIEGVYDGNDVPMVPRHKVRAGWEFSPLKDLNLNLWGNYVGKRYFINDQANSFSRLNGYFTLDANITYNYKDLAILVAANNILDKQYSEYAICNAATAAKNYYPNPGRNFSLKLEYKF
jgi:iron complex outermembrane receptor protein